ncbi:NAD(P)-dependent oxidoreductase [Mesorhizobium sp. M00.F.Ca.ET.216.01.1.1]|uniref:NAD-dependent epimerase/dehydratase family protein n=1 Tax=Mesorhizobium sp. M00.F.Ca.ET.216.01.1.1 TaxID=2500528 RepID=UPI00167315CB|nr:NAD(P)-dependent oxidoreductase [Mesorhizobium sp. M00.F.Ca.ET.216.01.1.1]
MIIDIPQSGAEPARGWKRVAVTGASGFIGHHLVQRLHAAGVEVLELSRSRGFDVCHDEIPLEGVDRVFHLAGLTGVPRAWEQPLDFFETNAFGTMRVLDQCRRSGCAITFLSAYVYGLPQHLPIAEDHPVTANNPYAFSKRVAEEVCGFFVQYYDVSCVTLRLFNTYGPGQSSDFLVPFIVTQILDRGRPAVEVKDLAPKRDYIYIDDVIDAILAASSAPSGSVFNIGSGLAYSVEQIIQAAMAAAGVEKPYRSTEQRRRNEIDSVVADITALRAAVGWEPRISLETGLQRLIGSMGQP